MPSSTVVYAPCLGSAEWSYLPDNKQASGKFTVNSVAVNNTVPLNLDFDHFFKLSIMTTEENTKIIKELSDILVTVGAVNIDSYVHYHIASEEIIVFYTILNVEQDKVNALTTTIASVCEQFINRFADKYTCDIQFNNNADPSVAWQRLYYRKPETDSLVAAEAVANPLVLTENVANAGTGANLLGTGANAGWFGTEANRLGTEDAVSAAPLNQYFGFNTANMSPAVTGPVAGLTLPDQPSLLVETLSVQALSNIIAILSNISSAAPLQIPTIIEAIQAIQAVEISTVKITSLASAIEESKNIQNEFINFANAILKLDISASALSNTNPVNLPQSPSLYDQYIALQEFAKYLISLNKNVSTPTESFIVFNKIQTILAKSVSANGIFNTIYDTSNATASADADVDGLLGKGTPKGFCSGGEGSKCSINNSTGTCKFIQNTTSLYCDTFKR
jgi:hypothetical protein